MANEQIKGNVIKDANGCSWFEFYAHGVKQRVKLGNVTVGGVTLADPDNIVRAPLPPVMSSDDDLDESSDDLYSDFIGEDDDSTDDT